MAYALDNRGGGQALPPFLQGRSGSGSGSLPMITPKSAIRPGETTGKQPLIPSKSPSKQGGFLGNVLNRFFKKPQLGRPTAPGGGAWGPGGPQPLPSAAKPAAPKISAPAAAGAPPATPAPAQTLYEFFKKDLENQRDSALANARTDASARGVFYGTPLTTSQGDIQTEFQRGLGQLGAGLMQNQEQNEISRLGLATQLLGGAGQAQAGGIDPAVFQTIGSLLAPRQGPTAPKITPAAPASTPSPLPQGPQRKLPAPYKPYENY